MKITLLIILTFLTFQVTIGQIATIQDPDGWANVRKEANGKSEIIHKVNQGEVFWYSYEAIDDEKQWVHVYIDKKGHELEGFIHKSRLILLDKAPEYSGNEFHFLYHLSPFDSTNRDIVKTDGKWIVTIDGHRPWGIDGYLPHIQLDSISVKLNGEKIQVKTENFQDLYEVTNSFKVIKSGRYFIVYQMNSDGAGSYDLAWVFDKTGLKQKLVGTII
jgi:hypothetical protein